MNDAIAPHGGTLVDRNAPAGEVAELKKRAATLPRLELSVRELADLEMIASGAFSPLQGFMGQKDYDRVVAEGRLASSLPWTLPITLTTTKDKAASLKVGTQAALWARADLGGKLSAIVDIE